MKTVLRVPAQLRELVLSPWLRIGMMGMILSGCVTNTNKSQSSEALDRVAHSLQNSGDYTTAAKLYYQILLTNPKNESALKGLGLSLRKTSQLPEARKFFEAELKKDSKSPVILEELGKTYIASGLPQDGIKTYKILLTIEGASGIAMNGLGVCLDMKKQHHEAQSWYRQALKQTPNDINIKSNLGLSLALGKKIKESINILLPLSQEASPSPNVLHNLAIAYALSGHVSKAREIFSKELNSQEVEANLATLRTIP